MARELKESKYSKKVTPSDPSILPDGYSDKVKVVKIYDGDSCHVHLIYNGKLHKFKCRLAEINTPERDPPQKDWPIARDYLVHLCTGGGENSFNPDDLEGLTESQLQEKLDENRFLVFATFHGRGRYNRALVTLQRKENSRKSFNTMLVEKDWAEEYRPRR